MRRLPPFRLRLEPLNEEAAKSAGFQWAGPHVGERSKLGGEPDFLQGDETPLCPSCHQPMTFYGQLDSVGDEIIIADCGMIYVFLCFDCYETRAVLQAN